MGKGALFIGAISVLAGATTMFVLIEKPYLAIKYIFSFIYGAPIFYKAYVSPLLVRIPFTIDTSLKTFVVLIIVLILALIGLHEERSMGEH